jgi:membrane protein DedA with SNARE-associated domain
MQFIFDFIQEHFPIIIIEYKYFFLFLGAVFEGLNSMVLGGFLVSVGKIKLLPTLLIFIFGYVINGYFWYFVGYFAGSKPIDKWIKKDEKGRRIMEKVEDYFKKFSGRAIIITKFTFSLTIATLIMAGSLKYNHKKFFQYNLIGSIGWAVITLFIGYFFGESYKLFLFYLKNISYALIFLGGAIALVYITKLMFGNAFIRSLFIKDKIKEFSYKIYRNLEEIVNNYNNYSENKKDR